MSAERLLWLAILVCVLIIMLDLLGVVHVGPVHPIR